MISTSRASLAELPEMNPGPVCRLDLTGMIELANAAALKVFGDHNLVGRSWFDLCPNMTRQMWTRMLSGTEPLQHEATINECAFVFTFAHRPDGEHVFVYGTDINALKEAEAELAEMARFPDMNPGPVCRLDRDGNVVLANVAARRLFADEELVGKCWLDLCPGMDPRSWDRVLQATQAVTHETQIGKRHLVFSHTPGSDGQQVFVYGTDLTDQKAAERALQQSEKMATLGTLAAGVAHELNNPAAAAQRAAEHLRQTFAKLQHAQLELGQLALSDSELDRLQELDRHAQEQASCPCDLDPLARSDRESDVESWLGDHGIGDAWEVSPALVDLGYDEDGLNRLADGFEADHTRPVIMWLSHTYPVYSLLEEIAHGSGRVAEIVTALKAYSYLGQAAIQAVDVNEGLRHTLIILRNKLKAGVTVEQNFAGDLPRIQAYGSELNQVWTNLIDNAVGAMQGQGKIILRTSREGQWIVVEVEDTGPGIPREIQAKIFDPFFTTKAPGEGTGLGLNTTYNIVVKKHRGHVDLDSKPGQTRFVVKLPIDAETKPPSPSPSPRGA